MKPEVHWVFGMRHDVLLDAAHTGGALAVVRIEVPPGMGSPPHLHRREAETFYVLDGEFDVMERGQTTRLRKGEAAHSLVGTWHNFTCVGPRPGVLLVAITPAGFEEMFRELSSAEPLTGPRPPTPEEIEAFLAVTEKYGLEMTEPGQLTSGCG